MINWGFLGASWVAGKALAPAVHTSSNARLYTVASRDPSRSQKFEPEKIHHTYADLIADPKVDAVYISLANHLHLDWTIAALNAGKHVLCEKPLAINSTEAKLMFDAARANDRHLVEAIWTRWHPRFARMVEVVKSGAIGKPNSINSSFTFTRESDDNYRMNPAQGGGSLLDVGPYQAHVWAALTDGAAILEITDANQNIGPTGIDLTTQIEALINGEIKISALTSFEQIEAQHLVIAGEDGQIKFPTGQAFTNWNKESSIQIGTHQESFKPVDPFELMITEIGKKITGETAWLPNIEDSIFVSKTLDKVKEHCQSNNSGRNS